VIAASSTPRPLVIFGLGTLARLARSYFLRDTDHDLVAFTVHRDHVAATPVQGVPCVPFDELDHHFPPGECSLFVAVGYTDVNRRRAEIFEHSRKLGYRHPSLISSRAHCWDDLTIGANCLIFDAVVIEPNVSIGDDVIVWSGAQISHDTRIGDHCFVAPNAVVLGDVSIGTRTFLGANATIRNGVSVAEDCVIGAGALLKRDTNPGEVYSAPADVAVDTQSWELVDL
jgi:sugar O-acyltransferase (sialic acid O-acetyltransferase NeuD family)